MNCPRCDYHSPFTQTHCPGCASTFEIAALEELGHLRYLRDQVRDWRADGVLAPLGASSALEATEERIAAVEVKLGLRPSPAPRPQLAPPASPPARVAVTESAAPVAPAPVAASASPPIPPPTPDAPATFASPPRPRLAVPEPPAMPPARADAPPPSPPAPRPAFSWSQVGSYLLSERTLNGLLSLGAFLILTSGTVISTLNPTNLRPTAHFASTIVTTLLFYLAGFFVRQKLALPRTGAVLLAIGAAFIPLAIWTLGDELLVWDPDAIWLVAALACLPIYLGSHLLLRDRTFAILTALAGGAEVFTILA